MTRPTGYPLALALVWFSATSGQAFGDETPRFEVVTPAWVADHAADPGVRVLDVRNSPYPYLRSHVPSAVHLADSTMRGPRDGWPARYVPGDAMGTALRRAGVTDSNRVVVYSDGRVLHARLHVVQGDEQILVHLGGELALLVRRVSLGHLRVLGILREAAVHDRHPPVTDPQ